MILQWLPLSKHIHFKKCLLIWWINASICRKIWITHEHLSVLRQSLQIQSYLIVQEWFQCLTSVRYHSFFLRIWEGCKEWLVNCSQLLSVRAEKRWPCAKETIYKCSVARASTYTRRAYFVTGFSAILAAYLRRRINEDGIEPESSSDVRVPGAGCCGGGTIRAKATLQRQLPPPPPRRYYCWFVKACQNLTSYLVARLYISDRGSERKGTCLSAAS